MWTELAEDADVSGGLRSEDGGLPAQPAVIKEYGRFAYLEGEWGASAKAGQEELVFTQLQFSKHFGRKCQKTSSSFFCLVSFNLRTSDFPQEEAL